MTAPDPLSPFRSSAFWHLAHPLGSPGAANLKPTPVGNTHGLAVSLEPVLQASCRGCLGEIAWFRSSWQHGGAETGFSDWRFPDGRSVPVMVKLPVGPNELRWTAALGSVDPAPWNSDEHAALPAPRVLAFGFELGGYDLGWFVVEKLGKGHTGPPPDATAVCDVLDALNRFHLAASGVRPVDEQPRREDWAALLARAREIARNDAVPDSQRWGEVIHAVQRGLPALEITWNTRPITTWCHGDFHPGNVLRRKMPEISASPCVLVDFALVHPGHWMEDALYIERLFWARPELLHGVRPVSHLAQLRRVSGIRDENVPDLANARRVLMAATAPAFIAGEGHPKYLKAALEMAEKLLPHVKH